MYQRDILAGNAARVYDRANSKQSEPASKFWVDVPADTELSMLSLHVNTVAGCAYVTRLEVQNAPINLADSL